MTKYRIYDIDWGANAETEDSPPAEVFFETDRHDPEDIDTAITKALSDASKRRAKTFSVVTAGEDDTP